MSARLADYLVSGGLVAIFILALSTLLWALIWLRSCNLRRGLRASPARWRRILEGDEGLNRGAAAGVLVRAFGRGRALLEQAPGAASEGSLEAIFFDEEQRLGRYGRGVRAIVMAAPLLGLLGTVDGMMETFGSLARTTDIDRGGGVAAGISTALVTTQLGLFVAIPGLLVGRLLDRREAALRIELTQLHKVLGAWVRRSKAGGR